MTRFRRPRGEPRQATRPGAAGPFPRRADCQGAPAGRLPVPGTGAHHQRRAPARAFLASTYQAAVTSLAPGIGGEGAKERPSAGRAHPHPTELPDRA